MMPEYRSAKQSGDKRSRILIRATDLFMARGFEGTTLEDVAIAASVGKATIYLYFADKADLFARCVTEAAAEATAPLSEILLADRSMEAVLTDFAEEHAIRMHQPVFGSHSFYEMARLLIGTSLTQAELAQSCTAIFRRNLYDPLTAYFADKIAAGDIRGADAATTARLFTQIIFFTNSTILASRPSPDLASIRSDAEQAVRLFLYGCAPGDLKPRREPA